MSQALATKADNASILDFLKSKTDSIRAASTKYLTPERCIRLAGLAYSQSDALRKCSPFSILKCVMLSAQLGLEIGGPLGLFYIIPRGGEACPQIGYRGIIQILWRSGAVKHIDAHAVYQGDRFEVKEGTTNAIVHVPDTSADRDDPSKITHVYATVEFCNGGKQFRWMTRKQVERVRAKHAGSNKVWAEHWESMAMKTVLFRLAKYLPVTPDILASVEVAAAIDAGEELPTVADAEPTESPKALPVALPEAPEIDDDGAAFLASLEPVEKK